LSCRVLTVGQAGTNPASRRFIPDALHISR
jgi:hypothetical protein